MYIEESNLHENQEDVQVAQEIYQMDSVNLAENLKNIQARYKPTPSFRLKNSIHFNHNPELQNGTDTFSDIRSNYSGMSPGKSSDSKSQFSGKNAGKNFIIRMTPLQRNRKNLVINKEKEFYRNVLMKNILQGGDSSDNQSKASSKQEKLSMDMGKSAYSDFNNSEISSGGTNSQNFTQSPDSSGSGSRSGSPIKQMQMAKSTFNQN